MINVQPKWLKNRPVFKVIHHLSTKMPPHCSHSLPPCVPSANASFPTDTFDQRVPRITSLAKMIAKRVDLFEWKSRSLTIVAWIVRCLHALSPSQRNCQLEDIIQIMPPREPQKMRWSDVYRLRPGRLFSSLTAGRYIVSGHKKTPSVFC